MSEIIECIKRRDMDGVKELLSHKARLVDECDENGISAAFHMIRTGDINWVKFLVEYTFVSFNECDFRHRSALHEGVMTGNLEIVKYLTERVGLDPCQGDRNLITPFELAVVHGFKDIEEYFEQVVGCKFTDMYQNPVRRGFYADPSIVRVGEDYYMVNSSFVFFPCIPISHSTDLVHWQSIGHAITKPEWAHLDGLEGGRGYWAPDISYYKGKFYITATLRYNDSEKVKRRQIIVSSEKPEGPYSEPVFIDEDGIDPSLFTDVDGRRYMLLNRGARIFELNEDATEKISEAKLLYYGDNKRAPEGPHLIYKDGYYYLFQAEGGTGEFHCVSVARSKTLMGVYEPCPYNPIMTQRDFSDPITCTGHAKPIQTQNGDWYAVYLCNRSLDGKYAMLGRETCLDPITWTADGWPVINKLKGPSSLQKKPSLKPAPNEPGASYDSFDDGKIKPFWMFSGIPEPDGFKIENSRLYIKGSVEPLSSRDAVNFIVRRQPDFNFDVICKMDVLPDLEYGQNYGMTGYYDELTYFTYGIYKNGDRGYALKLFEKIDEVERYTHYVGLPGLSDSIYLKIETDGLRRVFSYSIDGKNYRKAYTGENIYYLCAQAIQKGKRFTGAMVGMYAFGGKGKTFYAPFDEFRCHRRHYIDV